MSAASREPTSSGVEALLEALELRAGDAVFCLSIGEALEELGASDEAERAYQRAIELDPDAAQAHRHLGVLLLQRGTSHAAQASLQRAVELSGGDPDLHVLLAIASEQSRQEQRALAVLEEVVRRWPDFVEGHRQLGRLLGRVGELRRCADQWARVVALDPLDDEAPVAHAIALSNCGDHPRAIELLKRLAAKTGSAEGLTDLGMALHAAGKSSEAREQIDRAISANPKSAQARCGLALLLEESGDLAGAISCYRTAAELAPDWVVPHFNLGLALRAAGDLRGARDSLLRAETLAPGDHEILAALTEVRAQSAEILIPDLTELLAPPGNDGSIAGDLGAFSLAQLLGFLKLSNATGTLVLDADRGAGVVVVKNGLISAAASPQTRTLDQQERLQRRLRLDKLQEEEIRRILTGQANEALAELLEWRDGRFTFRRVDEKDAPALVEIEVDSLNIQR